jgi:hypothetical protein
LWRRKLFQLAVSSVLHIANQISIGRHLATPFAAWLRVPFSWFHSATFAFFPDETHRSIRRTFVSPYDDSTHRQFCGYCGTQLSQWCHATRQEENFIDLTLGSLLNDDLERLEELGLLQPEEPATRNVTKIPSHPQREEDVTNVPAEPSRALPRALFKPTQGVEHRGARWFEELIEDSLLGRIKRQKGKRTSTDGSTRVEWEVVEWTADSEDTEVSTPGTGKRKLGELLLETDDRVNTQS